MSELTKGVPINLAGEDHEAKLIAAIKAKQAPPGALGLPKLLDERRLKYHIPDSAFTMQAAYDRILVWQLFLEKETFGDTSIIMPNRAKAREKDEAPRGIVVSAGLKALDDLRTNGMDLGHVINFIRLAPWRMPFDHINATELKLIVCRSGDVVSSDDLASALRLGECWIRHDEESNQHVFVDERGKRWTPVNDTEVPSDY